MAATRPAVEIDGCLAAEQHLLLRLGDVEPALARPSLLPGWTVAHVLGHLVGNADSVVRRLRGVVEGVVVDQYPGGAQGRADEIDQLALLPYAELVALVRRSSAAVVEAIEAMPDDAWDGLSRTVDGTLRPAHRVLFSRWREVEVHLVDLGLGYSPSDWPAALVDQWLPDALSGLPSRAQPAALLAWAVGRGPAPDLLPWG